MVRCSYAARMTASLVVKCTWGDDAPERCNQALTVAATAVASGADVSLWLTGEAAWLAVPGRAAQITLEHAAPFDELLAGVLESGEVVVCSQCALRRGLTEADLVPGVRIAGSAQFVERALTQGVQALVY